jgi:dihydropyrimidinase
MTAPTAWPVTTILRGIVVVQDGRLLGSPGDVRFVKRKIEPALLAGAAV